MSDCHRRVTMEEEVTLELVDLGDATQETKQCDPYMPIRPDSFFGYASESTPWPGCPGWIRKD